MTMITNSSSVPLAKSVAACRSATAGLLLIPTTFLLNPKLRQLLSGISCRNRPFYPNSGNFCWTYLAAIALFTPILATFVEHILPQSPFLPQFWQLLSNISCHKHPFYPDSGNFCWTYLATITLFTPILATFVKHILPQTYFFGQIRNVSFSGMTKFIVSL